ncbi:MAG: 2OG-Fe(II) oxygenase [Candidatus Competibacter denitrificans]
MVTITTALAKILQKIQRPGDFYASGVTEIFTPSLAVTGIGPIALPLLPVQAEQLIAVAEQAPYGRGEETLVDTQVRRTWQIEAARVELGGRHWQSALDRIVKQAVTGLGVSQPVTAELYKLLVYDAGSFFVSHRDTEKAPGMFATLIIVLPSPYTGGELRIQHGDREARLDLQRTDPSEVAFAAFYADCLHEILPITSGWRLTLVYNLLLRPAKGRLPEPPSYQAEQAIIVKLLRDWTAAKNSPDDDSPEKLIYPLQHAYTPAALAFDTLKGADAAIASALIPAAEQADCDLHLALVSIKESGPAEYEDYYSSRRRRGRSDHDEESFEIVEVADRTTTLSEWQRADGKTAELGEFPFEDNELCPPDAFDKLKPDEQHFQEATGNEGASFERTYRRAGLVLWPRTRWLAVLNGGGLSVTLPYLEELTQDWVASGADCDAAQWREAHELTSHMLRTWPNIEPYEGPYIEQRSTASIETRMLTLLNQLRDLERITNFISETAAVGIYSEDQNVALVEALALLPTAQAADFLQCIVSRNAARAPAACSDLLVRCAALPVISSKMDLAAIAHSVVDALPQDPAVSQQYSWQRRSPVRPDFVVTILHALNRIDPALAQRAVVHMLAYPKTYDFDRVLVPAALIVSQTAADQEQPASQQLANACLTHLHARIAEDLQPPANWYRDSTLRCQCGYCAELSRFLADPEQQMWTFKAIGGIRDHVEESIRSNQCDLDYITDKRGRPFTLVCSKNQASYDRRVQQRQKDLKDAAQLKAIAI